MHMTIADLHAPVFRRAVLILVGVDILLILIHVGTYGFVLLGRLEMVPPVLRIDQDWSLAEMVSYAKWLAIVVLLAGIGLRLRLAMAWVWAVVFLELLADDAFQLHERIGAALATDLDQQPVFGLRPQDMGEMFYALTVASLLLALVAVAMWRGGRRAVRFSLPYLLLLAMLGVVGVGMDVVHQIIAENDIRFFGFGQTDAVFTILEDGGEMVVASLILAMTVLLAARVAGNPGAVAAGR